jgi:hypothetical protein
MFDRLHGLSSLGPPLDTRTGTEPYAWLAEAFEAGSDGLRDRMTSVLRDFLHALPAPEDWPQEALNNLFDLLQKCGDRLAGDIRHLVRTERLLHAEKGGRPEYHAGLLKCLIALGHHADAEFWLEQLALLGPGYGALIFSGLLEHGLSKAVRYLPQVCQTEEAAYWIRLLIPSLKDEWGEEEVLEAFHFQLSKLPDEARSELEKELGPPPELPDSLQRYAKRLWTNECCPLAGRGAPWAVPAGKVPDVGQMVA